MGNIVTPETPASTKSTTSSNYSSVKRRKSRQDKSDEVLGIVAQNLKASNSAKYASFGQHVVEELRSLSTNQAIFCQKLINDAIFESKLGNLNKCSSISINNDYPKEQTPTNPTKETTVYCALPSTSTQYTNLDNNIEYFSDYSNSQQTNTSQYFHTFDANDDSSKC